MRRSWIGIGVLAVLGTITAQASSLSIQATYWDADLAGEGWGGGLKLKREVVSILAADFRGGYVKFDDTNMDLVPIEGTLMVRLPFFIEPYLGVGIGYYFVDGISNTGFGFYGAAGLELHIMMLGLFAEVRQMELDSGSLDGPSANAGLMLRW